MRIFYIINLMKVVILAGGLGTRMQPYTLFIPKPMLPLGNKPLLEHIISWLKNYSIYDIVICVSYLGKTIEEYFGNGNEFDINIEYSKSEKPLGTAGQLKSAEPFINDTFICLYGDGIYEFDLKSLIDRHNERNAFVTMTLMRYTTRLEYGFIEVDGNYKVKGWHEKPAYHGLINIGCYVMNKDIFSYIPANSVSSMNDIFIKLLNDNKDIYSYIINDGFMDIGNKRSYREAYKIYLERLGKI